MPSRELVRLTEASLAPDENANDFWWMTDELIRMRSSTHEEPATNEAVVARLICWVVIFKGEDFVATMQRFRLGFRDVANDSSLQQRFRQSVKPAALLVALPDEVIFQADLYFHIEGGRGPRLRAKDDSPSGSGTMWWPWALVGGVAGAAGWRAWRRRRTRPLV